MGGTMRIRPESAGHPPRPPGRGLILSLTVALMVAACSGGGDADELADAIGEGLWAEAQADIEASTLPFEFTEADADCLGEVMVDAIGFQTLVDAGVTVENLKDPDFQIDDEANTFLEDPETAEAIADGMTRCVDFGEAMSEMFSSEMGVSPQSAECLIDGLMEQEAFSSALNQAIVGGILGDETVDPFQDGDPEMLGAMFDLMNECLTDEEISNLMGARPQP